MPLEKEEDSSLTLPFSMNHLTDYFKEKARRELNETPERRIAALEELKVMARDHKLTCDIHFVDDFLLQFLRHRKYNVSRALKQLVNFTTFRKNNSFLFLSIDNDMFFSSPHRHFSTVLPRRCPDGCTIILFELGKWDPNVISFEVFEKMGVMTVTQCLRDPMTQINGFKIIHDFTGTSLKQARYYTPSNIYLLYYGMQDCFPGRYKEFHLVSESLVMKTAWTVAKTILSSKLKQRVFLNPSKKDLLKHFPANVLPAQYGGLLEDYYSMEFAKEVNRQQEGFMLQGQRNFY